jgi:hypothetical protein
MRTRKAFILYRAVMTTMKTMLSKRITSNIEPLIDFPLALKDKGCRQGWRSFPSEEDLTGIWPCPPNWTNISFFWGRLQ